MLMRDVGYVTLETINLGTDAFIIGIVVKGLLCTQLIQHNLQKSKRLHVMASRRSIHHPRNERTDMQGI